jgi:hypothetical protein
MKNRLTILVICMICSSVRANPLRMCSLAEREDCFHIANELCSEIPVSPEFRQCLRDLSDECIPERSCPPPAPPNAKAFPDKKRVTEDNIIGALKPRSGPITRGLPIPKEKEREREGSAKPIPNWVVPRLGERSDD